MRTLSSHYTIQNFLAAIERGEIRVNRDYQRSDQVWPDAARSYLIETVLLEYPIPKLALHQVSDPATGESHQELVDGQQRSAALRAFFADKFALSAAVEDAALRGLRFSTLSREQQMTFRNFQLDVDLFLGAEGSQIREVFRRINSYTVPLNPEEQRHAQFQGVFKWFLHRLGLQLNKAWEPMGIFAEKALVRLADTKLLAEIVHAMLHGISTTSKRTLDRLYKDNDERFDAEGHLEKRIVKAVFTLRGWEELHGSSLMKPFQAYSLLLALVHVSNPLPTLQAVFPIGSGRDLDREGDQCVQRLSRLAKAVDDVLDAGKYASFVRASSEKTNVKKERETRFKHCCQALVG